MSRLLKKFPGNFHLFSKLVYPLLKSALIYYLEKISQNVSSPGSIIHQIYLEQDEKFRLR